MLREHIRLLHLSLSDTDAMQTEEFTVPLADDDFPVSEQRTSFPPFSDPDSPLSKDCVLKSECPNAKQFSQLSPLSDMSSPLPHRSTLPLSVQVGTDVPQSTAESVFPTDSVSSDPQGESVNQPGRHDCDPGFAQSDAEVDMAQSMANWNANPEIQEHVQLYFNEHAFVTAYTKSNKFHGSSRVELAEILQKLRRFAAYQVPILGRANQRRVAGCPECMKPFNHGFTDLKKHLLVSHLDLRKDVCRFAIDFTHPTPTNNTKVEGSSTPNGFKQHLFTVRSTRPVTRCPQRKFAGTLFNKRSLMRSFSNSKPLIPLATVSTDGRPVLVRPPRRSLGGSAPVHRVIPGTGVSARDEDMKSLDEVESEAPSGRGGIIPLDENGNPIMAAVLAASLSSSYSNSDPSEAFLPKVGRQHIQLAYSYPVFKRLLELHNVPMPERVQLINRMNYYSKLHVIMDVMAPSGAQKRFTCPTCMYTSIHSLADIRKHILGSHCGVSTKRFRICLRASRHDATTYRLHSDERMIRFVEDHGRRQASSDAGQKTSSSGSVDTERDRGCSQGAPFDFTAKTCAEDLGHFDIKFESCPELHGDAAEPSSAFDMSDVPAPVHPLHDTQIPSSDESATPFMNGMMNAHSTEISNQNEQVHRHIELPFSTTVLRTLLEREGMLHQLDDLMARMRVYSSNRLTVVSCGNRIHAYICYCGRRFSVVREDANSDIRPASLADCRRHILGVHAKIPQELLTLCCQASRISKESGYRLYSDTSLLALADQHKFRNNRSQMYRDSSSPSKLFDPTSPEVEYSRSPEHSLSSAAEMVQHPPTRTSFPKSNGRLDRMSYSPPRDSSVLKSRSKCVRSGHRRVEEEADVGPVSDSVAHTWNSHQIDLESSVGRHSGLDLEPPRRLLTADESACWSHILSLPDSWTLERIVRLAYNVDMFERHLRNILPGNDEFIQTLHDRMLFYTRHSIYIARLSIAANQSQRIYVCCACLTTSMHGLGDVRKHILGVHAHIPERFKTVAMNSSRLNREDYSLQCDPRASQSLESHSQLPIPQISSKKSHNSCPRVLRRRQRSSQVPPDLRFPLASPPVKKARCATGFDSADAISDHQPLEPHLSPNSEQHQLNGSSASIIDPGRPPIVLTIPRPKAFCSSICSDKSDYSVVGTSDTEVIVPSEPTPRVNAVNVVNSTGSRSRRSMILKSKRPCPTTI